MGGRRWPPNEGNRRDRAGYVNGVCGHYGDRNSHEPAPMSRTFFFRAQPGLFIARFVWRTRLFIAHIGWPREPHSASCTDQKVYKAVLLYIYMVRT